MEHINSFRFQLQLLSATAVLISLFRYTDIVGTIVIKTL